MNEENKQIDEQLSERTELSEIRLKTRRRRDSRFETISEKHGDRRRVEVRRLPAEIDDRLDETDRREEKTNRRRAKSSETEEEVRLLSAGDERRDERRDEQQTGQTERCRSESVEQKNGRTEKKRNRGENEQNRSLGEHLKKIEVDETGRTTSTKNWTFFEHIDSEQQRSRNVFSNRPNSFADAGLVRLVDDRLSGNGVRGNDRSGHGSGRR